MTRMVREVVNETRTVTCYTPQQQMVTKPVTRYVCEPTTVVQKCYRPVPVTRTVQRTIYQTYCTTEMVNKVDHPHDSRVRDRDGAGHEDAQGRRASALLRDAANSFNVVCSGCHVRSHVRAPLWRRRLRCSVVARRPACATGR